MNIKQQSSVHRGFTHLKFDLTCGLKKASF